MATATLKHARASRPRRPKKSTQDLILEFLLENRGTVVEHTEITAHLRRRGWRGDKWHQRLSELRVNGGWDILSWRDRADLRQGQYLLIDEQPAREAKPRKAVSDKLRAQVVERDGCCQHKITAKQICGLREGDYDEISGATVRLQADHVTPHSKGGETVLENLQAMCARHQVTKSNRRDGDQIDLVAAIRDASRDDAKDALRAAYLRLGPKTANPIIREAKALLAVEARMRD